MECASLAEKRRENTLLLKIKLHVIGGGYERILLVVAGLAWMGLICHVNLNRVETICTTEANVNDMLSSLLLGITFRFHISSYSSLRLLLVNIYHPFSCFIPSPELSFVALLMFVLAAAAAAVVAQLETLAIAKAVAIEAVVAA